MQMPARRWRDAAAALALPLALAVCAAFAPAYAADSTKVLRVAIPVAETGFDPQAAGDAYSNYVNRTIFDPLYKYDYLARPFRLVPNTATALPEISADRLTWTMRVRPAVTIYRYENALVQPWLLGYKYNPIQQHPWQYLDIDMTRRASALK
jgi:ABC-type transport system substrate-binding protein